MKALIQRVTSARLSVDGREISSVGAGLVVYLGVAKGDDEKTADAVASKISRMRIFADENDKLNYSVSDKGYSVLLVSQFTLCADCSRGNRPDFTGAEGAERAKALYLYTGRSLEALGVNVAYGVFGADMTIEQINSGPVTIELEIPYPDKKR